MSNEDERGKIINEIMTTERLYVKNLTDMLEVKTLTKKVLSKTNDLNRSNLSIKFEKNIWKRRRDKKTQFDIVKKLGNILFGI
jgi:predicted RNA-binding protein with RPS1 domain